MEPRKFRAYLEAEIGKKAADLETVSPGSQGERTDRDETSPHGEGKLQSHAQQERLRAILRAPELVQDLYKQGRISQTTAAKLGATSDRTRWGNILACRSHSLASRRKCVV